VSTDSDLDLSGLLDASPHGEDRVQRVLRAVPAPPFALRVVLGVLVAVQAPIVLTWLFNSDPLRLLGGAVDDVHLVRDGAFGFVILTAAGITVWRPRWAVPSFAIASAALLAQLAAAFADDSISVSGWNEAFHLVLLLTTLMIGACGLWLKPMPVGESTGRNLAAAEQPNVVALGGRRRQQ